VCQLLDAGANKYHLNTNAETPLHLACHGGHDATVLEFLCHNMSKGGNLNIQYVDTKGNTGLHVVAQVTSFPP
jgi:ankyrin repeat protein